MTFFPPVPQPEDDNAPGSYVAPPWAAAPIGWLPSRIGASVLLARTSDVAVMITGLAVYASGLQIDVQWLLRSQHQNRRDWAHLMDRFDGGRWGRGETDLTRSIRFGVVLADGTKVVTDPGHAFHSDPDQAPQGPVLTLAEHGGSGDDSFYTTTAHLWLWPLPEDGRLEVVLSWPEFGITEARHAFDDLSLDVAAHKAQQLWDD